MFEWKCGGCSFLNLAEISVCGRCFRSRVPKWQCQQCTYENEAEGDTCTMCGIPRLIDGKDEAFWGVGSDDDDLAGADLLVWACQTCAYENADKLNVCQQCCAAKPVVVMDDEDLDAALRVDWMCKACSYGNPAKHVICEMCFTPKEVTGDEGGKKEATNNQRETGECDAKPAAGANYDSVEEGSI